MHALAFDRPPARLSGGFWAELAAFSLAEPPPGWPADLVVRVMPSAEVARKETIIQRAVASAGYPTPAVRAYGGPESALGRAFMVMDLAPGAPLIPGLTGAGAVAAALPRLAAISDRLATCMARLHALDPRPVRAALDDLTGEIAVTADGLLTALAEAAAGYGRADLVAAARWLAENRPARAAALPAAALPAAAPPEVICHGDLHPFNLLADGDRVTVLDWSGALLGPPAYDVALTSVLLAEPALVVPAVLRPVVRIAGRWLARRFRGRYERLAWPVSAAELRWHAGVVCLRSLTEVAGWVSEGTAGDRPGHPWLVIGPALAARLRALTGVRVRPR
jgi:aminoglycoside phosphotransferase (APT) family kinase protein